MSPSVCNYDFPFILLILTLCITHYFSGYGYVVYCTILNENEIGQGFIEVANQCGLGGGGGGGGGGGHMQML